jgi:hypothetical protein
MTKLLVILNSLLIAIMLVFIVAKTVSASGHYDETKVPQYTLPDPLLAKDGSVVTTARQWKSFRRQEILSLFEQEVYGRRIANPEKLRFEFHPIQRDALGAKAIRKQVTIHIESEGKTHAMHLLVYLPTSINKKVPLFLAYNFNGNHSISADPGIDLPSAWMRWPNNHRAQEKDRGKSTSRWPVEMILDRGYGIATVYYGDIEGDHPEGWKDGIRSQFTKDKHGAIITPKDSGAIAAWAWGLSRAMDYLETDGDVNAKQVIVMGHSRLGKTSLWAGANDERFAITISSMSGCGGAALSRRAFGETVKRINTTFPHWFCGNFKNYNDNESKLSIDQHELIALMAPRAVYIASAEKDLHADPHGEFIAGEKAGPVFQLFGKTGVGVKLQPEVNQPVGDYIGYHIRTGKHDVTDYDWNAYLDFADRHFKRGIK